MRMIGERKLVRIPNQRERQDAKRFGKSYVTAKCTVCGADQKVKQVVLYKCFSDGNYLCYPCYMEKKAKDKKEMNRALINLARSKGLIK